MRYGYTRVSTREQADNGAGLDAQHEKIAQTGPIDAWFTDEGESGSNGLDTRLGLAQLLDELAPGDEIVVYRLDRLARDLILQETLFEQIKKRGAKLVSCSESETRLLEDDEPDPSRTLIRQILGAVSQYERTMIRMRMQAGKAIRRAQGQHTDGRAPYGWQIIDKQLVKDPEQQKTIGVMRQLRSKGATYDRIADHLNTMGYPSQRGGTWSRATVFNILTRDRKHTQP